jgi:hypothetical protein
MRGAPQKIIQSVFISGKVFAKKWTGSRGLPVHQRIQYLLMDGLNAFRASVAARAHAHSHHGTMVAVHKVIEFGLLVRGKNLVERGFSFCVLRDHLRSQISNRGGCLCNSVGIVTLDRGVQCIVRVLHAVMKVCGVAMRIGKDGGGALLLLGSKTQRFSQHCDMVLYVDCGIGWRWRCLLRKGQRYGEQKA